jgi:hypothetical protein
VKPGTIVRMRRSIKLALRRNGCDQHVREFGGCVGIVEGPAYPSGAGPEVDVRWLPSRLRYGYDPDELKVVGTKLRGWRRSYREELERRA